ncbi:S1 family peptidase [Haloferula sp.]|uniref:S1 family peptidase n=1 Tax=Haloferula sp. TaxID=2497595 RepID=UPI00329F95C2
MKSILLTLLGSCLLSQAAPLVVDDIVLEHQFQVAVGELSEDENHCTGESLSESLKDLPRKFSAQLEGNKTPVDPTEAVYLIGAVYKCDKCDDWHTAGIATAWCLSEDGLMASNHHVFAKAKGAVMGVCNREGKAWAITEIVAADPAEDIAIFRVKGTGFKPLPLGEPAEIGSRVRVISHPARKFYIQTFGEVSRYYVGARNKEKNTRMMISAEYAKGSSGGPVLNSDNEVVGMVSSTQPIYYSTKKGKATGPLQMTVRNCVPVSSIRKMIAEEPSPE